MAEGKFVSYLRVSTDRQGKSGLGLEAQRAAVTEWLNGGQWKLLAEHVEVESGKNADRPELTKALHRCRITGATLVIAKLDRLSRDAHFLLGLQKAGVEFIAVDMPAANKLTIGIMALVAEQEREMISKRTKDALAAAKARGTKLGGFRQNAPKLNPQAGLAARQAKAAAFSAEIQPIVSEMRQKGLSLRQIGAELASRGVRTPRGGQWTASAVQKVLGAGA